MRAPISLGPDADFEHEGDWYPAWDVVVMTDGRARMKCRVLVGDGAVLRLVSRACDYPADVLFSVEGGTSSGDFFHLHGSGEVVPREAN